MPTLPGPGRAAFAALFAQTADPYIKVLRKDQNRVRADDVLTIGATNGSGGFTLSRKNLPHLQDLVEANMVNGKPHFEALHSRLSMYLP